MAKLKPEAAYFFPEHGLRSRDDDFRHEGCFGDSSYS
jgi:hypothetical protein